MDKIPALPDDDSDFTPDLARQIIAKYQELLSLTISPQYAAELGRQVDELEAENAALREALRNIAYAPPGYGHGPTLVESIQIARKALGE